jgi:RND family efflux transporter MFP subunit
MTPVTRARIVLSIVAFVGIIALGALTMVILSSMKTPPATAEFVEQAMRVEGVSMTPENHPVALLEHGVARSLNVAPITPEVSGLVVEIHPRLEVGEVITKDDVLFVIDPRDYQARVDGAKAEVARLGASVERLRTQQRNDQARLKTLTRSRDLAESEFKRLDELYVKDQVGTRSGVEGAERQYNAARDVMDQMVRALSVYPISIQETGSLLASAKAMLSQAETALERTRVVAPFAGRVREVSVEQGQYITPGKSVLTLADDSVIEIAVSLDSRDARQWLEFNGETQTPGSAWFTAIKPVKCDVRWTEEEVGHDWEGVLHLVENFNSENRRLTVAVRVDGREATQHTPKRLPLVDGMFCEVEIPGRMMRDVYRLPQWAVSFDGDVNEGNVYLSVDNRLKVARVKLARRESNYVFVSEGLAPGDVVITTRLVDPLVNSLLDTAISKTPHKGSKGDE